jgi:hypothetical protein
MPVCEIIYIKSAKGWTGRALSRNGETKRGESKLEASQETFPLFYDCVSAARMKGYTPNVKCL